MIIILILIIVFLYKYRQHKKRMNDWKRDDENTYTL